MVETEIVEYYIDTEEVRKLILLKEKFEAYIGEERPLQPAQSRVEQLPMQQHLSHLLDLASTYHLLLVVAEDDEVDEVDEVDADEVEVRQKHKHLKVMVRIRMMMMMNEWRRKEWMMYWLMVLMMRMKMMMRLKMEEMRMRMKVMMKMIVPVTEEIERRTLVLGYDDNNFLH